MTLLCSSYAATASAAVSAPLDNTALNQSRINGAFERESDGKAFFQYCIILLPLIAAFEPTDYGSPNFCIS